MGTPLQRWILLICGCLAFASLAAAVWPSHARSAAPLATSGLELSRLDADPVPLEVLGGALDHRFAVVPGGVIRETGPRAGWWRLVSTHAIPAQHQPYIVLGTPESARIEAWLPGASMPVVARTGGVDIPSGFSSRASVVPLRDGLRAGHAVYLRVGTLAPVAMPVGIEPLAQLHHRDLTYVAWRAASLVGFVLLMMLALGFWLGIGERGYAYLLLTLAAQLAFFATQGGEIRLLPGLSGLLGEDPRSPILTGLLASGATLAFLAHGLRLRDRNPMLWRIVAGCLGVLLLLVIATVAGVTRGVLPFGHAATLAATAALLVACVRGTIRRERAAGFLLMAWLPVLALSVAGRVAELGLWVAPVWLGYALPAALVLAGTVTMIGLTDALQKVRRDRDRVSRLATFDTLTGALSRPAMQERLSAAVTEAHRNGTPLSVVFFDVDRFKRVNDDHGHRVGDNFLKFIALRTRNRLRTYDLMGRWGGDEMVVMLPDTRLNEALGVAENLRSAVNCRPLSIDDRLFEASLSLGVAELAAGESVEHLIERADSALYASKTAGRDRVTGHDPRITGSHPRFVATSGQT